MPEYNIWRQMRQRCCSSKSKDYASYGGRGITVCERWRDNFADFLADVGQRPSKAHTLDRIDNHRGYEPLNVRWATRAEQARNRRDTTAVEFCGQTLCVKDVARLLGIKPPTLYNRLFRMGLSVEEAARRPHGRWAKENEP